MRFTSLRSTFRVSRSFLFKLPLLFSLMSVALLSAASIPIVNPSFESGTAGWTSGGGVFDAFPPTAGMFTEPVPDGISILYLGGASPGPGSATQILGSTVEANTTYTLDFWVGFRAEPHIQLTTYTVSLLPSEPPMTCGVPARGTFILCSLEFHSSAADVGLPLTLQIRVGDASSAAVHQLAFDNFTLDASSVPEPSQCVLVFGALAGLLLSKRSRFN